MLLYPPRSWRSWVCKETRRRHSSFKIHTLTKTMLKRSFSTFHRGNRYKTTLRFKQRTTSAACRQLLWCFFDASLSKLVLIYHHQNLLPVASVEVAMSHLLPHIQLRCEKCVWVRLPTSASPRCFPILGWSSSHHGRDKDASRVRRSGTLTIERVKNWNVNLQYQNLFIARAQLV